MIKIKQTIMIFALLAGTTSLVAGHVVNAATCGGADTSIVACDTKLCAGGEDPYEGIRPTMKASISKNIDGPQTYEWYMGTYGHKYGRCKGDVAPATAITDNGVWGLLMMGINILTAGVGIAAVGGIVYGSVLYSSAGGNAERTKKAKEIIINVVIGIIAYALMYAFLNFIVPGGMFIR